MFCTFLQTIHFNYHIQKSRFCWIKKNLRKAFDHFFSGCFSSHLFLYSSIDRYSYMIRTERKIFWFSAYIFDFRYLLLCYKDPFGKRALLVNQQFFQLYAETTYFYYSVVICRLQFCKKKNKWVEKDINVYTIHTA